MHIHVWLILHSPARGFGRRGYDGYEHMHHAAIHTLCFLRLGRDGLGAFGQN